MHRKKKVPVRKTKKSTHIRKNTFARIINPFSTNLIYWIVFAIPAIFYLISYPTANANCLTLAMHDDLLYYQLAKNLTDFNWLGEYNKLTLTKMPGFAIYLAFSLKTGIPYLLLIAISQVIAVTFFLRKSMWLFQKTKLLSLLLGIMLLYNPIFAAQLRIYRLQLPAICFIIFLGVIISMFNPETSKKRLITKITDGLTAMFAFGFLFYTREENMLYFAIFGLTIFSFILFIKKIKYIKRNIFLPIMGILGILLFWITIASLNYKHYGRFIICERTSSVFTKAIKTFHSVADDQLKPDYPLNSASREKILKISTEVPEFRNLGRYLYQGNQGWSIHSLYLDKTDFSFKKIDINDLPTSHFEWFWIDCLEKAGYYKDAITLAEFYNEMDEKINIAIEEGRLKKRNVLFSAGPYFISAEDIKTIFRLLPHNYFDLFPGTKLIIENYKDVLARENEKVDDTDLDNWKNTLKVNVIKYDDKKKLLEAKSSAFNTVWNFFVMIFAYIAIPLIQIATFLALIVFIVALIKKRWIHAVLIFIYTSSYILFLIMLTVLDVLTGYDASNIMYYLPSYAAIIISAFLSINFLLTNKISY